MNFVFFGNNLGFFDVNRAFFNFFYGVFVWYNRKFLSKEVSPLLFGEWVDLLLWRWTIDLGYWFLRVCVSGVLVWYLVFMLTPLYEGVGFGGFFTFFGLGCFELGCW